MIEKWEHVALFNGDDAAYLSWLARNPDGYVLNARRNLTPDYMVLHRAGCRTIGDYGQKSRNGGFTERSYVKVCASSPEYLRTWLRGHGRTNGEPSSICSICN